MTRAVSIQFEQAGRAAAAFFVRLAAAGVVSDGLLPRQILTLFQRDVSCQ